MPLRRVPPLGQGLVDAQTRPVLTQLQSLKLLPQQMTAAVTASSSRASRVLNDAQSPTVSVVARLAGSHGARTVVHTTRRTADPTLFDLEVWFPDDAATAVGASSVDTAADTITFASAPGWTTGAGPVFLYGTTPGGTSTSSAYFMIRSTSVTFRLATTRANARNATSVDLTSAGGTFSARLGKAELFSGLAMRPTTHPRYAPDVVNKGRDGQPASEYVRLTAVTSNTPDNRPADGAPGALSGGGTGEVTFTGIRRRDHVLAVLNLTTGSVWQPSAAVAVDHDRLTLLSGNAASGDRLLAFVLPD